MIAVHLTACGVEAEYRRPFWSKATHNIIIDPTFRAESDGQVAARVQHRSRFTTHLRMLDALDNKHVPAELWSILVYGIRRRLFPRLLERARRCETSRPR
jgi:hypothetical protein